MSVMRIKEARKMNGNMKQKELAIKTGFSERSIIRWEKGETEPNREAIERLASAKGGGINAQNKFCLPLLRK